MSIYWAVFSSRAANSTVHTASEDSTLFNFIRQHVQFPKFWGRYIARHADYPRDPYDMDFANESSYFILWSF